MPAILRPSGLLGPIVLGAKRAIVRTRLLERAAWRPSRQGQREALALLVGTAVIWATMMGADEIGARLAT